MDLRNLGSPIVSRKIPPSIPINRQNSGGMGSAKKEHKSTRLRRISSISNHKQIRASRIKREYPNPAKFWFFVDTVENALKEGLQLGEEKLILNEEDNDEIRVCISLLQQHLEQIQMLRIDYLRQLKIQEGASNLDHAYGDQPHTKAKKKSKAVLKNNLKKINEKLLDLEDEMFDSMGYLQITFKGLLDIQQLMNNDTYEVSIDISEQKWKTKGTIRNKQQRWRESNVMMTILGDSTLMDIQAVHIRRFLGNLFLGSAKFNAYELISLHPQNVVLVLKGASNDVCNINFEARWRFHYTDPDYGQILDFEMHDVIIGSSKLESKKKRARQQSVQRAQRVPNKSVSDKNAAQNKVRPRSTISEQVSESDFLLLSEGKFSMPSSESRSKEDLKSSSSSSSDMGPIPNSDSFNLFSPLRNVCSVLHRSPSQYKPGRVGYKPILVESESARKELMNNLQLDTDYCRDSDSLDSVCHLLEAYDNLWLCIEQKREFYNVSVLNDLEARLNKISMLTRNKITKHERKPSLTDSEIDAMDAFDFLNEATCIPELQMQSDRDSSEKLELRRSSDSGINLSGVRECMICPQTSDTTPLPEDYSSDEEELNFMLQEMVDLSTQALEKVESAADDVTTNQSDLDVLLGSSRAKDKLLQTERVPSRSSKGDSLPADDTSIEEGAILTTGKNNLDFLLTTHLIYSENLLQNLKPPGPLQWKTKKSLNMLQRQIEIIDTILTHVDNEQIKPLQLVPQLENSKELLALWRACCGERDFVAPLDNFSLAMDRMFGDVWKNYPDVAHLLFPAISNELITTTFDDGEQPAAQFLTIFQFYDHFKTKIISGLEDYVSEVAEDLSLYGGLTSEERYVVNVTLKRMIGMGYNSGILRAVPEMLLKPNESCQIAENYLKNITRDAKMLEEVGAYFVSVLEHSDQARRQGACRALAKIKYTQATSQLIFIRDMDLPAVRLEAKQATQTICPE